MASEQNDDIKCGNCLFDCNCMQKLASKKVYVLLFGLSGFIHYSLGGYLGGTLSTIEKQFRISSTNLSVIMAGFDLSAMLAAVYLCFAGSKLHRPRLMAFAMLVFAAGCLLIGSVFLIYGAGQDALDLTDEFEDLSGLPSVEQNKRARLCDENTPAVTCNSESPNDEAYIMPQVMFFFGLALAAIGDILFANIGITYLDDNVSNAKSPFLVSFANFIRTLGPPFGYLLASSSLKLYVAPTLSPLIDDSDPRWIGAWWLGWFITGFASLFGSFLFVFFPRTLPRAAARLKPQRVEPLQATSQEFKTSVAHLLTNKTFVFNLFAGVCYKFGGISFSKYQAKYLEVQFKVTSATASMLTGSASLIFNSIGLLASGIIISRVRPTARSLAAWNVFTSLACVMAICSFAFIGCGAKSNLEIVGTSPSTCNQNCQCDFTPYSPVCGANNISYLSACHAGCTAELTSPEGGTVYRNCSCIGDVDASATSSVCPVDCTV